MDFIYPVKSQLSSTFPWMSLCTGLVIIALSLGLLHQDLAFWLARYHTGCRRAPQYPHFDPLFGYDLHRKRLRSLQDGTLMSSYTADFARLGKTWEERIMWQRTINTIEPANVQYISTTGFDHFVKSSSRSKLGREFLGGGILISDGVEWRHSRNLIKPMFATDQIANLSLMKKHVDRLLKLIPRDGGTTDILPMMKKMYLDLSTEVLFGESFDSQLPEKSAKGDEFLRNLDKALKGWNRRRQDRLAWLKFRFDKSWKQDCVKVHQFVDAHVEYALSMSKEEGTQPDHRTQDSDKTDEKFILLWQMAKEIKDPVRLRFEILNIFLPSRNAAAVAVSSVLFQLARHPKHWQRLREIALNLGDAPLTLSTLKSLSSFRHVIQEAIRQTQPTGRHFRTASTDVVLPTGGGSDGKAPSFITKGTTVCIVSAVLHRDTDIWGEDALQFRPERWIDLKPGWEFVPFFGGPRICPAQQQVYTQATYILLRLVLMFERIENRDEVWEFQERWGVVPESRNGVKIALLPSLHAGAM